MIIYISIEKSDVLNYNKSIQFKPSCNWNFNCEVSEMRFRSYIESAYGFDKLSVFILVISFPFMFFKYTVPVAAAFIVFAFYRSLSHDIPRRQTEEIKFEGWMRGLSYKFSGLNRFFKNMGTRFNSSYSESKDKINEKMHYVIVTCPQCGQKLRLPRRKGKLLVTCRKCSYKFEKKT